MKDSLGAATNETPSLPTPDLKIANSEQTINNTEKRGRTNSFFSMYSAGAAGAGEHPTRQLGRIEAQDLSNIGSIKEMALFSRIVNY